MNRAEQLLSKGYFPSQLPPCFTTKDLGKNHKYFTNTGSISNHNKEMVRKFQKHQVASQNYLVLPESDISGVSLALRIQ